VFLAVLNIPSFLWSGRKGQKLVDLAWSCKDILEFPCMVEWAKGDRQRERKG
jgi:hypothetical protein